MKAIKSFRDLHAWQVAIEMAVMAYALARLLPAAERFELAAQIRRAAVSVPSNVAEGQSIGTNGRYLFHVRVALGSVGELDTHIELAKRLNYLAPEVTREFEAQLARSGQLLHGLVRSIRTRQTFTALVWLTLLTAPALLWSFRAGFRDVHPVLLDKDVLARPFASFDFVLAWIHVDVLAHWLS